MVTSGAGAKSSREIPEISIVLPVLNEALNLPILYQQLREILQALSLSYELIFIDDGSTDTSAQSIASLHEKDPGVRLLSFSRNFGHQAALSAGMDFASGKAVLFMDADLQHPPALIADMIRKWREGFEIVTTTRRPNKRASFFKRYSAIAFYRFFNACTSIKIDSNAADFRLLDRKVVNVFKTNIRERTRFLRGLTAWVGFRNCTIPYTAAERYAGKSKYSLKKMVLLAVDGICSFSAVPLYGGVVIGFLLSIAGFIYAVFAIVEKYLHDRNVPGWTSLVILITIIGGIQLILMGILGIYIAKIYDETKQRPLYLVRDSLGFTSLSS